MRRIPFLPFVIFSAFLSLGILTAPGLSLSDLQNDPQLTPERFAGYFQSFKFHLSEEVQPFEKFLSGRAGDCDDYATLASHILRSKGFTTKLVVVFMEKEIHAVCYVRESQGYLDYNKRQSADGVVRADGTLGDIANKVAQSFQSNWTCVAEFTLDRGKRRILYTDFPQNLAAR